MSAGFLKLMAAAAAFFLFTGTGFAGSDVESLVGALEQKYAHKSFTADFTQTARLAALDITETATGKAWFSHPGKMRWQYLTPDQHEIITNGERVWIFRPAQSQVMVGDARALFKSGAGGTFLSDITQIRADFTIEPDQSDETHARLRLTPKKKRPDLAVVLITIAKPSHEIQVVETRNTYDDTTRFMFTHIQFIDPGPDMFDFTIPDGTSIIDME